MRPKGYRSQKSIDFLLKYLIFIQYNTIQYCIVYEPRSDRRDLLAIKVQSEIFTEKERAGC